MFEQDYLLRMLIDLAAAIRRSMQKSRGDKDYQSAAEILDQSISTATDLDGSVLLTLAPESIASVLKVANTDPRVVIYIANSMKLQAHYLRNVGNNEIADLREKQAISLANAYNFELSEIIDDVDDEMFDEEAFIKSLEDMCND